MIIPLFVYAASIGTIEISALLSGSLHEFPSCLIEYIIYPTTESIASLTHRICCRHKKIVNTKKHSISNQKFLLE